MNDIKQGLICMRDADYHRHSALSYTGVKEFARSPAHYRAMLEGEKKITPAMNFGSAYHAYILSPKEFEEGFAVVGKGPAVAKFMAEHPEMIAITQEDFERITTMAQILMEHPCWPKYTEQALYEIPMFWMDPETGVQCRTKIDILSPGISTATDLKSTTDARPTPFMQVAFRLGYHVQAAWTLRGLETVTGKPHDSFVFIAQEKVPPYSVRVYEATESFIEAGNTLINQVLPAYRQCLETDTWPSYEQEEIKLIPPKWANISDEEQAVFF